MKVNQYVLQRDYGVSPDQIDEGQMANYLALIMRLAALDGFTRDEMELANTIMGSLDLEPSVQDFAANLFADDGVSIEEMVDRVEQTSLRVCAYRDAYRMALADGAVSSGELVMLQSLPEQLKISQETADQIREIVDADATNQGRFLKLLNL